MHPSLGLMLPLLMGQPATPSAVTQTAGFAKLHAKRTVTAPSVGCDTCGPSLGGLPPFLGPRPFGAREVCPPAGPPAPVLAMKAVLPDGAAIVLDPSDRRYDAGSVFGFRPGYAYRLKITNLPAGLGATELGASLEVYGSIVPRPNMKYMEFPAALHVSRGDVTRAVAGGTVTKVIYLENPEKAIPQEELPNLPLEVAADSERDALETAGHNGRIVAILRIGDLVPAADELAKFYQDGTVLLPGEHALGRPSAPPVLSCHSVPLYDPILGPKPTPEECFPNGGDGGPRIGIGPDGRIGNLDVTDVAAEYTRGTKREATVSNVVCLCAPRFVARRVDTTPGGLSGQFAAQDAIQVVSRSVFRQRAAAEELMVRVRTLGLESRARPAAFVQIVALDILAGDHKAQAVSATSGLQVVSAVVQPDEIGSTARLALTKSVDPPGPYKSGDVVTVTLKYSNFTGQPVTDLVISDNLSPRLEFVEGSAEASRPSNITTAANEAGSQVVRFDIPGPIPSGGSGVAVFKVKVR
jgi:uncharacterized repeat protein (TIGR01451 family)